MLAHHYKCKPTFKRFEGIYKRKFGLPAAAAAAAAAVAAAGLS